MYFVCVLFDGAFASTVLVNISHVHKMRLDVGWE